MSRNKLPRGRSAATPRSRAKALLNPGWVIAAALVLGFTYLAIAVLAPWQLGKNTATNERNHQLDAAFSVAPASYHELFDTNGAIPADQEWRRVELSGHYVTDQEVLLRMRPVAGGPAFNSLTPFQLDSGEYVLVNRGYVPAENTSVPEIAPPPDGEVTITAHVRKNEARPAQSPMEDQGYRQVWGINTKQISDVTGLELGEDFVQLTPEQPGVLAPQPLPQKEHGPYLSYGLQWIAFGIMAPLGLGYFVLAELRERRRDADEAEELEQEATSMRDPFAHPQPYLSDTPDESVQDTPRRRARYGDNRHSAMFKRAKQDEERF